MPFPAMISLLVSFFPMAELRVELIENCTSCTFPSYISLLQLMFSFYQAWANPGNYS